MTKKYIDTRVMTLVEEATINSSTGAYLVSYDEFIGTDIDADIKEDIRMAFLSHEDVIECEITEEGFDLSLCCEAICKKCNTYVRRCSAFCTHCDVWCEGMDRDIPTTITLNDIVDEDYIAGNISGAEREELINVARKYVDCINVLELKEYKHIAMVIIHNLPSYIWRVPSSSSGKYHPTDEICVGGLIKHQTKVFKVAEMLLSLYHNICWTTAKDRDAALVACLIHDGLKSGYTEGHTVHEHPILMANFILELGKEYADNEVEKAGYIAIAELVKTHMGEWVTSKYSDVELERPVSKLQKLVHECDYLASRKVININI